MENSGRKILITGGATGIGQAVAVGFARLGDHVTVSHLTNEQLPPEFSKLGIEGVVIDVTDNGNVRKTLKSFERIDILVNCAGTILRDGQEHEPDGFARVVDVNLNGTMRMCAAAKPFLEKHSGCVINIASMLSFFGSGFVPAYSASKGGIAQLTKSLAIAWAEKQIRVNAVAPGWIKTNLTSPLWQNEERSQAITQRTPLGRWGEAVEVFGAIRFLCSDEAAFITGVVLPVDGGYAIA